MRTLPPLLLGLAFVAGACGSHDRPSSQDDHAHRIAPSDTSARGASSALAASASATPSSSAAALADAQPARWLVPERTIDLGVYLAAPPPPATVDAFIARARKELPGVEVTRTPGKPPFALVLAPPVTDFAPPSGDSLQYFATRLADADKRALASSGGIVAMHVALDDDPGFSRLRAAYALVGAFAKERHGVIWDDDTREAFDQASWQKERIDGWADGAPDLPDHFTIHYYENGGGQRAVSLGLQKFGLPDLAIDDVPTNLSSGTSALVCTIAQELLTRSPAADGRFTVDVGDVKQPRLKKIIEKATTGTPLGRTEITLVFSKPEEGDADNRLARIRFTGHPLPSETERQGAALIDLFGKSESVAGAEANDPELLAIQKAVQAKLPSLRAAFQKGLPLGESILVKAPFTTDSGGVEWMWITVRAFEGGKVKGILDNSPSYVRSLSLGAPVEVNESEIADYVWNKKDGTREGGESEKVFARREAQGK